MKKIFVMFVCLACVTKVVLSRDVFYPLALSFDVNSHSDAGQNPGKYNYVYGWRFAIFGGEHERMIGLATAIGANLDAHVSENMSGGLHIAGFCNIAKNCEIGIWQLSTFYNEVEKNCNGLQLCAAYNKGQGWFKGLQVAMWNEAESLFGAQIGLINKAKNLKGAQLGVLNFVKESIMPVFPILRIGW